MLSELQVELIKILAVKEMNNHQIIGCIAAMERKSTEKQTLNYINQNPQCTKRDLLNLILK